MYTVSVKTPSRLHFTLIDLNGEIGRVDGGIGVALDRPNVIVKATLSDTIEVRGKMRSVAEEILRKVIGEIGGAGVKLEVLETIPEHVGLGSKTQLSLAVATAASSVLGVDIDTRRLARITRRGGTSGIGVAAFEVGGFILDGGHSFGVGKDKEHFLPSSASPAPPAPLLFRHELPSNWFFVVGIPDIGRGAHGPGEVRIFEEYCPIPRREVERLCHIILMKIIPAVVEGDISSFGEGLTEIQNVGFKRIEVSLQPPDVKELMDLMLKCGAAGAGMSSFGPAVFGVIDGWRSASSLLSNVEAFLSGRGEAFIAKVNNSGAQVLKESIVSLES